MSESTWQKLSQYFTEKGIYLLTNPREKLSPGVVYQTEDDDIHAHKYTTLRNILTHKSKGDAIQYTLPESEYDAPNDQLEGVLENKTNMNLAIDFAEKLLNKIKSGLHLEVSASHSRAKIGSFQISSISTESLDIGQLEESVKNYKVKDNVRLNNTPKNYYIVTTTWYSESIRLLLGDLTKDEINFYLKSFVGNIGGKFKKTVNNTWSIVSNKKVAFGISIAQLDFDRIYQEVIITIVPHNKFIIPLTAKDIVAVQDLSSMPLEKTTIS